jgi:hypothetical protein
VNAKKQTLFMFMKNGVCSYSPKGDDHGFNS